MAEKKWLLKIFTAVFCSCSAVSVAAGPPHPFNASYSATYNGMAVTAERQLLQRDSSYEEKMTLSSLLGSVRELSQFDLVDNRPRPLRSEYALSLFGMKRTEQQIFDWGTLVVDYQRDQKQRQIPVDLSCLDITTHRLALATDLRRNISDLEYCVIHRGKRKTYRYQLLGEMVLDTAVGPLNTFHIQRLRDDDDNRSTELWMAVDWDLLLVRLHQNEDDEEYLLELASAQVAGQEVTALPTTFQPPITVINR